MPALILHAGFHKTGTSAIQRFAASHRRLLARQGLLYPRLWPENFRPVDGHHFVAHAVAGNERFLTRSQAAGLVDRWRRSAGRRGLSVMLSSEAICRLSVPGEGGMRARQEAYLEQLRDLLEGFDVTPVLVLRRQDDFVRSLYQEHVSDGLSPSASIPFERFLCDRAPAKPRFLARLGTFQSVFPSLRVLVYERLRAQGLIPAFFEACGLKLPPFKQRRPVRPSLSPAETLVKQRLNPFIEDRWRNRLVLRWLRTDSVQQLIEGMLGHCACIWPSVALRRRFIESFEEENREIGRLFLGGDMQPFPALSPAEGAAPPPSVARVDEAVAALARRHRRALSLIIGRRSVASLIGDD
jgi:hypothetical protein